MNGIVRYLWLIPALPLLAAGLTAVVRQRHRKYAASLAIGSMVGSLILSLAAFATAVRHAGAGEVHRDYFNFNWFTSGDQVLKLGWVLDPLTAVMLVMVCFVGLLIFIYSVGYMSHDQNFTRFFCFLSLFASAMLGVIIANNLLLLFICWELVGLTSYLLIGFWYHKPSAAAAAKKAFITTRIGDLAFLLGMAWLYSQAGTLTFYDNGHGCLEQEKVASLVATATAAGITVSTGIAILIFCGAVGKSGQVPLHVWLPDAMEGPTPVSALIHAATMVAAGVFLVARVYPLMSGSPESIPSPTVALKVVTWVGAITAVFAATIAVAQTDIKRILAYSTVSQLGYMMMGLGVGGVGVGMFHLITHAFFKALLFMGAGSVIHGCHEEQDIRRMGGIRKYMPVTFATYAIGMMALSGVPLFFSGFWSKDEILHAAHGWGPSHWPFYLGAIGALLTAFYMTRQVLMVFFGNYRGSKVENHVGVAPIPGESHEEIGEAHNHAMPHESPTVMTAPLVILAVCSVLLGFVGTPVWPWFQRFVGGEQLAGGLSEFTKPGILPTMGLSTLIVAIGIGLGWWLYGRKPVASADETDILERKQPEIFSLLRNKYFVDEAYEWAFVGLNRWWARACDWLDTWVLGGLVALCSFAIVGIAWVNRVIDEYVVNLGFDEICRRVTRGGSLTSRLQNGRVQHYLRIIGLAVSVLVLALIWGCRAS